VGGLRGAIVVSKVPGQENLAMSQLSRREFLKTSSLAALAASAASARAASPSPARGPFRGTICLFSKPVVQLSWQELAQSAKHAGFGGIDLTVRAEGHVLPENAERDLPKAVAAIRAEGLEVPMITTELVTADDPTAVPILRTAHELSIPYLKPGYYHYKFIDVRKEAAEAGRKFRGLVELAEKYEIQVGFHNHAGYIGGQIWDIVDVMDTLNPKWAGYYFDLENSAAEGGAGGWKINAHLVMPRMKMMAVKDLLWKRTAAEGWEERTCPLGEGMCHYKEYLKIVAASSFHGPISLHLEYQIPGVSDDQGIALAKENCPTVMAAAQRDLATLKPWLREAYEGA
jgi:sugar phosphate isomerase/epimerase